MIPWCDGEAWTTHTKIQRRAEVAKDQLRKGDTCLSSFQEQFPLVLSFPSPSPQNKRSRATEDEVVTTTPDRVSPQSRNQICSAHDRQGEKKEALYARSQNRKYWGRKWVSPNLETAVSMSMRDHNQNDHTSNGSEAFSLLLKMPWSEQICIAIYLCLIETICPKIRAKSLPKNTKSQFPVDVRCSKTSLLKLPTMRSTTFSPVPAKIATVT